MSALTKLAEAKKSIELDVDTQATIIGLAKNTSRGISYFDVATAVAIKEALITDKIITKDVVLFEVTKGGDARPVGDWLQLEEASQELTTI